MFATLILAASLAAPASFGQPAVADRPVFRVGGKVTPPKVITRVEPKYPEAAREEGQEGTVLVSGVVETDGLLSNARVVKTLGEDFSKSALEALSQWKFEPGQKAGEPVAVYVQIEMTFRLR